MKCAHLVIYHIVMVVLDSRIQRLLLLDTMDISSDLPLAAYIWPSGASIVALYGIDRDVGFLHIGPMARERTTEESRSRNMQRIRSKGTSPERAVCAALRDMGLARRYRRNVSGLPGRPDIVIRSRRKAIFVHGCFWHQHTCCDRAVTPKTNRDYWIPKLRKTVVRDADNISELRGMGWEVLVIWECELGCVADLRARLQQFLS